MFQNIGWPEILIIIVVLLVLFGGKLLPKLSKNIGGPDKETNKTGDEEKDISN